jgi:stage II sporulation SpoAA-like protein
MVEKLTGFPDNVVAFAAKGRVTKKDYEEALTPAVEQALQRHAKIRCYYELGTEFAGMDAGAFWEDFKVGVGHLTRWEKVAVVTDVDWIRHAVNLFRFLMPGEIKVFPTSRAAEARAWIVA